MSIDIILSGAYGTKFTEKQVTSENEAIDREIQLIECQREDVQKLVDEENAKTALVESSLRELITVHT